MNDIENLYNIWKQGDYLDKDIRKSLERSMSFQNVIELLEENERLMSLNSKLQHVCNDLVGYFGLNGGNNNV